MHNRKTNNAQHQNCSGLPRCSQASRGAWSKVKESANMGLAHDLKNEVDSIIKSRWSMRNSSVVPETENVQLGNDAGLLDGAVLYAGLAGSTKLERKRKWLC